MRVSEVVWLQTHVLTIPFKVISYKRFRRCMASNSCIDCPIQSYKSFGSCMASNSSIDYPILSYKLPEFQKFYGRRYWPLPVRCKATSYQSSRSFMITDRLTNRTYFPLKIRSYENFGIFWLQIVIFSCPNQSSQVLKVSSSQNCRFIHISCHYWASALNSCCHSWEQDPKPTGSPYWWNHMIH